MLPQTEHALVALARHSIRQYLTTGERLELTDELSAEWQKPVGAFVSLTQCGELRGCTGHPTSHHRKAAADSHPPESGDSP